MLASMSLTTPTDARRRQLLQAALAAGGAPLFIRHAFAADSAERFKAVRLGRSSALAVGEGVFSVGELARAVGGILQPTARVPSYGQKLVHHHRRTREPPSRIDQTCHLSKALARVEQRREPLQTPTFQRPQR